MSQPLDTEQQRARFREKAAANRAREEAARAKIAARRAADAPPVVPTEAKPRRSGTETRQRTKLIAFRVRVEEYALYREEANRQGVHLADLARVRMKGGKGVPSLRSVTLPPIERKLAVQLLGQLGKLGSNANQIARRANRNGFVDGLDLDEFRAAMNVLVEMRAALFEVLGRAP
jgi:hypothetical protein